MSPFGLERLSRAGLDVEYQWLTNGDLFVNLAMNDSNRFQTALAIVDTVDTEIDSGFKRILLEKAMDAQLWVFNSPWQVDLYGPVEKSAGAERADYNSLTEDQVANEVQRFRQGISDYNRYSNDPQGRQAVIQQVADIIKGLQAQGKGKYKELPKGKLEQKYAAQQELERLQALATPAALAANLSPAARYYLQQNGSSFEKGLLDPQVLRQNAHTGVYVLEGGRMKRYSQLNYDLKVQRLTKYIDALRFELDGSQPDDESGLVFSLLYGLGRWEFGGRSGQTITLDLGSALTELANLKTTYTWSQGDVKYVDLVATATAAATLTRGFIKAELNKWLTRQQRFGPVETVIPIATPHYLPWGISADQMRSLILEQAIALDMRPPSTTAEADKWLRENGIQDGYAIDRKVNWLHYYSHAMHSDYGPLIDIASLGQAYFARRFFTELVFVAGANLGTAGGGTGDERLDTVLSLTGALTGGLTLQRLRTSVSRLSAKGITLTTEESQLVERFAINNGAGLTAKEIKTLEAMVEKALRIEHINGRLATSCFVAGTPLLTPEGAKLIETFRRGDRILSRDESNAEAPVEVKVVEETFVRVAPIWRLMIGGRAIRTTAEHPFYVRGKGWLCAKELEPGYELSSHDGQWVSLEAVTDLKEVATVYNLRVESFHTYFVGSREWGFSVWAHNANYEVFLDAASNTYRLRNVATQAVVESPLGGAIEFAGTARGRAEATRWLTRNNPNIAVPLSEAVVGPTLTADELATGLRAERQLGHPLHVSPHVGADFVDTAGRSFDALLQPGASANWATQWTHIRDVQLPRHLAKADFTIVDVTGLTASQIADVTTHINGLSAAQQAKIVRIGF